MESQDKLSLHIYPTADRFAEGSLYLDAGEGPVEQEADWRLDKWRLSPTQEGGMIAWNTEGDFPFPYQNIEIELHGGELFQVYVDGENFPCDQNRFQTSVFKQVKLYLK